MYYQQHNTSIQLRLISRGTAVRGELSSLLAASVLSIFSILADLAANFFCCSLRSLISRETSLQ